VRAVGTTQALVRGLRLLDHLQSVTKIVFGTEAEGFLVHDPFSFSPYTQTDTAFQQAHSIYNYMSDPFVQILALSVHGFYPEKRTHCDQIDHFLSQSVSTLDRTSKCEKVPWALEKGGLG
jgi:hypothetical protein